MNKTKKPVGMGGIEYEHKVRGVVSQVIESENFKSIILKPDNAGGYANNVVDMYLNCNGIDIPIEIKMDRNAQMGGPSIRINENEEYFISDSGSELTKDIQLKMLNTTRSMEQHIRNWIKAQKELVQDMHDDDPIKKMIMSNPSLAMSFLTTKEIWSNLQKRGMLKPLNERFKETSSVIHDWYARKDCNYIQIGKAGLFSLLEDPLNLSKIGVPQLNGEIQVRCRMTRSGGGGTKQIPNKRTGRVRCIAELKTKNTSLLSLDNHEDVKTIFAHIENELR